MEGQHTARPPAGGVTPLPIALRADPTYFIRLSNLGNRLSKAATENQNWHKKEHRVSLPDVYWKGCEEVATFLGMQKRGQTSLACALMESLGSGAAVTAIATAHQGLFPHTQVSPSEKSFTLTFIVSR